MTVTFKFSADQGELHFERVPDDAPIPAGAMPIMPTGKHIVLGHSETGHHHVMSAECVEAYELPADLKSFLVVNSVDELIHLRDYDTHEPIRFEPGRYEVTRLREETDDGWRGQED